MMHWSALLAISLVILAFVVLCSFLGLGIFRCGWTASPSRGVAVSLLPFICRVSANPLGVWGSLQLSSVAVGTWVGLCQGQANLGGEGSAGRALVLHRNPPLFLLAIVVGNLVCL